ncbi:MAG: preprotein translocase subunit Sec61beta [Ignisphaera sp.]|uniref:Preprotein translocase subunit SecG n=1 Tax=Ignisphaera aggregans TaxID=334771 RepID=A0A7J3MXL2_9CREN
MSRSSKKGRRAVGVSSYVGLVRFYEEVEEQIKIPPHIILLLAYITSVVILALRILLH